jgi:hypothetical protein
MDVIHPVMELNPLEGSISCNVYSNTFTQFNTGPKPNNKSEFDMFKIMGTGDISFR